MKTKRLVLSTIITLAATATVSHAASGTWSNTAGGTWSTTTNWSGGTLADGAGNTADFSTLDITATATVNADAAHTLGTLKFGDTTASNNWSLTGSTITLDNSGSAGVIDVSSTTQTSLAALNIGTIGLNKTGTGSIVIGTTLAGSGVFRVSQGKASLIQLSGGTTGFTGSYLIDSGATLQVGNGSNASFGNLYSTGYAGTMSVINNGTFLINRGNQSTTQIAPLTGTGLVQAAAATGGNTVSQSGSGTIGGSLSFELVSGNANLGLVNTYTGNTTITAGTLTISGQLGSGNYAGTISNAGTLAVSSSSAQTLSGTITGAGVLTKSGTGTLTLAGNNTLSGVTTVSGGTLRLTGTNTSAVTVNNGGTLNGANTGTSTGLLTTNAGATISADTSGPFTSNGVNFSGITSLVFSTTPTPGNTYDVLNYGTGSVTNPGNFVPGLHGVINHDAANHKFTFTAGAPGTRTWNTTTGIWDSMTTANFLEGDQKFGAGDTVIFNDPATASTVTLVGTLLPASVSITNTNAYTFSGTGTISGASSLAKSGTGTLTLPGPHAYSGGTAINGGTIILGNASSLGTGAVTINAGAVLDWNGVSPGNTFTLAGGVIDNTSATASLSLNANKISLSADSEIKGTGRTTFQFKWGTGTLDLGGKTLKQSTKIWVDNGATLTVRNGTYQVNSQFDSYSRIVWDPTSALSIGTGGIYNATGATTLYNVSGTAGTINLGGATTFNQSGSKSVASSITGAAAITFDGNGTTTLNGINTYSGATIINGGTLALGAGATMATSGYLIAAGTVLDVTAAGVSLGSGKSITGAGTISGDVNLTGAIAPGAGATPATLTLNGNLTLQTGSTLAFDVSGSTSSDLIQMNGGSVGTSSGLLNLTMSGVTGAGTYVLIDGAGGTIDTSNFIAGVIGGGYSITLDNSIPGRLVANVVAGNTLTWNGTGVNPAWNLGATNNWLNGVSPAAYANGDIVNFTDAAAEKNVTLDEFLVPGAVNFISNQDYTLSGSGSIDGAANLSKSGTGVLTIQTYNTFTGSVDVTAGKLVTSSAGNLGNGTSRVNLSGGATFQAGGSYTLARGLNVGTGGGSANVPAGLTLTHTGAITGGNTLVKEGDGTLAFSSYAATGNSTSTPVLVTAGTLDINGNNIGGQPVQLAGGALGNNSATNGTINTLVVNSASTVMPNTGWILIGGTSGSGSLTISSTGNKGVFNNTSGNFAHTGGTTIISGKLDLYGGTNVSGGPVTVSGGILNCIGGNNIGDALAVTVDSGTWNLSGSDTVGSLAGAGGSVVISSGKILTVGGNDSSTTYAGVVSDAGALTKAGTGTFTLTGANTYSGNTTVNAGTLALEAAGSLKFTPNDTTVSKITGSGSVTLDGSLVIAPTGITVTTGTWTLVDVGTLSETYGGTFTVKAADGTPWTNTSGVWTYTDASGKWTFTQSTGVLTLAPGNTFATWMSGFTFPSGADTSATGDADGDGNSNLIENVFGTAPNAPTTGINQVNSPSGSLTFKHPVNATLSSDVTYSYVWSTDLNEWNASGVANTGGTTVTIGQVVASGEATVTAAVTTGSAPKLFIRLTAVKNP